MKICNTIILFFLILLPAEKIKDLTAAEGTSEESVELKWIPGKDRREIAVYRSTLKEGPYEELGITDGNVYIDRSAIPGIVYWYRILPLDEGSPLELSPPVSGYRKTLPVKGEKLESILKKKVRKHPVVRDKKEKALIAKFNKLLLKFYTNNVKLSIIMAVGKHYIKKGDLILLNDFDEYIFDYPERMSYFIKKGKYRVKYYSKKFSKLMLHSRRLDPAKNRLSQRLFKNSLVFCIDTGETKVMDEDDVERVVKTYEAVGVSTEYYRDSHDWRFRTILTGSSNNKIKKMMKDAQKRKR